jgi:hypothetical protein
MPRSASHEIVGLVAAAVLTLSGAACCHRPPGPIVEVNLALLRAKDACATLYAPRDVAAIEVRIDEMNRLADARKCARARSAAGPILPDVLALSARVEAERNLALDAAKSALDAAESAVERAREAEAGGRTSVELSAAERALAEARRMSGDACAYPRATLLARDAAEAAERARAAAKAGTPGSGEPAEGARRP